VVSKNINNKRGNIKTGLTVFFKRGCCNNQKNVIFCDRPVLLNLFKRVAVRKPGLYKVNGGGGVGGGISTGSFKSRVSRRHHVFDIVISFASKKPGSDNIIMNRG
jgi:hypothetical protein